MKILVVGGTGLVGTKVIQVLKSQGHNAVAAAPSTGVDTIKGEGLAAALEGVSVVIDLVNSPSFAPDEVMKFFTTHEANLTTAERAAGVRHHVVLSIVGTDRVASNDYFRAKVAQEKLVKESGIPFSIIRSTQFFEFLGAIADSAVTEGAVHISTAQFQPIAVDDVASIIAATAIGEPMNNTLEIAGPIRGPFSDIVKEYLDLTGDKRRVQPDAAAPYFGSVLDDLTLVPLGEAKLGSVNLGEWVKAKAAA